MNKPNKSRRKVEREGAARLGADAVAERLSDEADKAREENTRRIATGFGCVF